MTTACERAAQWISLGLDGELTEIEEAGMRRHLDRCERCHALGVAIGGFTAALRAAPDLAARESVPVVVYGRSSGARLVRRAGAAAVLAGAAAVLAVALVLPLASSKTVSALEFASARERLNFAHAQHVRIEPEIGFSALAPSVPLLASRALE
jgi:anti-sigma factor RsiW